MPRVGRGQLKTYLEFFAGAGMVRLALSPPWSCAFANDIDSKKTRAYRENFGDRGELREGDVWKVSPTDVPDGADLAWASFPCQDLSVAGKVEGLGGDRSSTFWGFWEIVKAKARSSSPIPIVAIENVVGLLYANEGRDFATIIAEYAKLGYLVGAFVANASLFVPQSRPRVFIVGVHESKPIPADLVSTIPQAGPFHTKRLTDLVFSPRLGIQGSWLWWKLPVPSRLVRKFADIVQWNATDVAWHTREQHAKLMGQFSPAHRMKIKTLVASGATAVLPVYRRTRRNGLGDKIQQAEARFDERSGALRTPVGGSSRQLLLFIQDGKTKSRLITPREAARVMGIPDAYRLPANYNEAYHLVGDGVVVDVVSWIKTSLFDPILSQKAKKRGVA